MPLSKIEVPSLDVGQLGSRNILINGSFTISQRGNYTSATAIGNTHTYYLDRWKSRANTVSGTLTHSTGYPFTRSQTALLTATSAGTGYIQMDQLVETNFYQGQTVVLSAWIKSNNPNARMGCYTGTWSAAAVHSGNGSWEKLSVSFTVGTGYATPLVRLGILSDGSWDVVSIASGDYIEVSEVQLEVGEATPFEHESYGTTLQKCQRYFQVPCSRLVSGRIDSNWQGNPLNIFNTTRAFTKISLPATMRALPTATIHNPKFDIAWNSTSRQLTTQPTNVYPDINALGMDLDNSGSGFIVGYSGHVDIGSGCFVTLDAEL